MHMKHHVKLLLITTTILYIHGLHALTKPELLEVKKVISPLVLDIRYATRNNFTKEVVYPNCACYLLEPVVTALAKAAQDFNDVGYTIKIWDGYRPLKAQYTFWELVPDERYVANPEKGSRHNRGCAVDLTLVDAQGTELDMGTDFDDFSEKAHRDYTELSETVLKNRMLLETIMHKHGFTGLPTEWWHFDYNGWEEHPILDCVISD